MKYYTGIGSRKTPSDILALMSCIAAKLESKGYILRSGGADGADSAFANGVVNSANKEIFLPWERFNGITEGIVGNDPLAEEIAARFHPAWEKCSYGARKLHTRNVYQIMGAELNKFSDFVICWTPSGSGSGGTGQALRIARHYNVPITNLGIPENVERAHDWLSK